MDRVKKRLFGSVQRLSDERILDKLADLLVSRNIDDAAVRGIESILNRMLGQEVRNYHCGVNY